MRVISKSLAETAQLARDFLANLPPAQSGATVVGLTGELGSGKTTFVQALAATLGVAGNITSPTFVIEKIYLLQKGRTFGDLKVRPWERLIHIDAYRLDNGVELTKLGFAELLADKNNLIVIEWVERVQEILEDYKKVSFKFLNETSRQISFA